MRVNAILPTKYSEYNMTQTLMLHSIRHEFITGGKVKTLVYFSLPVVVAKFKELVKDSSDRVTVEAITRGSQVSLQRRVCKLCTGEDRRDQGLSSH